MGKNVFGGGNEKSLYTPMSETEQEVLVRLVEQGGLRVHIVGWGYVDNIKPSFGDLRFSVPLVLDFDRPAVPVPVHHFDLELRTPDGLLLFADRQPVTYNNQPLWVSAGLSITMIWDIAIKAMNPEFVKRMLPGATGLTSRLQDKDSGKFTLTGNMRLTSQERKLLLGLRAGEQEVKKLTAERLRKP